LSGLSNRFNSVRFVKLAKGEISDIGSVPKI
jgi:hypothetical protein